MSTTALNESDVELASLDWFGHLGYEILYGLEIAPGEAGAERDSFSDVVLVGRLRDAIDRLNPKIPAEARDATIWSAWKQLQTYSFVEQGWHVIPTANHSKSLRILRGIEGRIGRQVYRLYAIGYAQP